MRLSIVLVDLDLVSDGLEGRPASGAEGWLLRTAAARHTLDVPLQEAALERVLGDCGKLNSHASSGWVCGGPMEP